MKKISLSSRRLLAVVVLVVMLVAAAAPPVSAADDYQVVELSAAPEWEEISYKEGYAGQDLGFYIHRKGLPLPSQITIYTDVKNSSGYDYGTMPQYFSYTTNITNSYGHYGTARLTWSKQGCINTADSGTLIQYLCHVYFDWDWLNIPPISSYTLYLSPIPDSWYDGKILTDYGKPYRHSYYPTLSGGSTYMLPRVTSYPPGPSKIFYVAPKFKNLYSLEVDEISNTLQIEIIRTGLGSEFYVRSKILRYDENNTIVYESGISGANQTFYFPADTTNRIVLVPEKDDFAAASLYTMSGPDDPDDPDDPGDASVTVYIKNSQTGALIANSNIVIDALVNGEYYTIVNRTEPSGIFSITLQPTGGGQPNPDGYRLIATADGYNNPMPEINFTVDDYKNYIYCLLDPIAGGPVNENKTFIDFFVRDMSSNPISGATVKFDKYTLITNSQGYTVFEVDKNNNYSWTVSKSGYGPLTGNAVIGDNPRHTINTVLAPIVTPTITTPIPTSPSIGPTPTMTAPTGEPVSNWLEWFAAHFGMILGGGAEIGKIFMWLCFAVPAGVYVGKEAKAGAAGFMAGAGIVTLFFVLIGWVPIWLLVLLALIIGLLYAKVFNTPDNGGGR